MYLSALWTLKLYPTWQISFHEAQCYGRGFNICLQESSVFWVPVDLRILLTKTALFACFNVYLIFTPIFISKSLVFSPANRIIVLSLYYYLPYIFTFNWFRYSAKRTKISHLFAISYFNVADILLFQFQKLINLTYEIIKCFQIF